MNIFASTRRSIVFVCAGVISALSLSTQTLADSHFGDIGDIVLPGDEVFYASNNVAARSIFQEGHPAWKDLEAVSREIVSRQLGVPNDDRLRHTAGAETRALMYLNLMSWLAEGRVALIAQLFDSDKYALVSELEGRIRNKKLDLATLAKDEYDQWFFAPCAYHPIVGDPDEYLNRPDVFTACLPPPILRLTPPPVPSSAEFTTWAIQSAGDIERNQWLEQFNLINPWGSMGTDRMRVHYNEYLKSTLHAIPFEIVMVESMRTGQVTVDLSSIDNIDLADSFGTLAAEAGSEFLINYFRDFLMDTLISMLIGGYDGPSPHDAAILAGTALAVEILKQVGIAQVGDALEGQIADATNYDIFEANETVEGRTEIFLEFMALTYPDFHDYRHFLPGTTAGNPEDSRTRFEKLDEFEASFGPQVRVGISDPFSPADDNTVLLGSEIKFKTRQHFYEDGSFARELDDHPMDYGTHIPYQNWDREYWSAWKIPEGFLHIRYMKPVGNVFPDEYINADCPSNPPYSPVDYSNQGYRCLNSFFGSFTEPLNVGDPVQLGLFATRVTAVPSADHLVILDEIPDGFRFQSHLIHAAVNDYSNCELSGNCFISQDIRYLNSRQAEIDGGSRRIVRFFSNDIPEVDLVASGEVLPSVDPGGLQNFNIDAPVVFNAVATDDDVQSLNYNWVIGKCPVVGSCSFHDGGTIIIGDAGAGSTVIYSGLRRSTIDYFYTIPGLYRVTVTVTDNLGEAVAESLEFRVSKEAGDDNEDPFADPDLDGIWTAVDNCPDVANPFQEDSDNNGVGDACQLDDFDGDGIDSSIDNCPVSPNPSQRDFDGDGIGDACDFEVPDRDSDGVPDRSDNCPFVSNAVQMDTDGDGIGDVCDPLDDIDDDGIETVVDNCPNLANPSQSDVDLDGIGDACDLFDDIDDDGIETSVDNCPTDANPDQSDVDFDSLGDACDSFNDTDGDGIANAMDLACPASDLAPTVVIAHCDSGVLNSVTVNGCSIMDTINTCPTGTQGELSRCVSHATNKLKKSGLISGKEKGQIQKCAKLPKEDKSKADKPKKNKK